MILTLLALAVVAPQPIGGRSWIMPEDYPTRALREDRSGYTGFRLTVLPSGKPLRCEVTAPSGWEDLDAQTCRMMMKRGRFKPSFDPSGAPVHSVYRSFNSFWIPGGPPPPTPKPSLVDDVILLKKMPTDLSVPTEVNLAFTVDAAGTISDCTPYSNDVTRKEQAQAGALAIEKLGAVACNELATSYRPTPAIDEQGQAVPSIQTARLHFMQAAE